MRQRRHRNGFSLVEVLLVVAIIGIIAAIASFSYTLLRERSRLNAARRFEASVHNALGSELLAEWKMNSNLPPPPPLRTEPDSSGNGFSAFYSFGVSPQPVSDCIRGMCLNFDGAASYLQGSGEFLLGSGSFTLMSWVKVQSNGLAQFVLSDQGGGNRGFNFFINASGILNVDLHDGSGDAVNDAAVHTRNVYDGKWHLLTLSCNRLSACIGYVDGVPGISVPISQAEQTIDNILQFRIAKALDAGGFLNGTLDEMKLYRGAIN